LKSYIKNLKVGSGGDKICITVHQNDETDTVYYWDLAQELEIEAFDVEKNHDIVWDNRGCPQIVTDQNVILTTERCAVKVYAQQPVDPKEDTECIEYPLSRGHRFDGMNHNWMI